MTKTKPKFFSTATLCVLFAASGLRAQGSRPVEYSLQTQGSVQPSPPSNSVSHISIQSDMVWIGTSKGLARSISNGRSWESFRGNPAFASNGIFGISLKGDTIWTSTGFSKDVDDQSVQTGSGYTFSTNNGATWIHRPQTLDGIGDSIVQYGNNTVKFLPILVPEQNVTFDLALSGSLVWIASWSSGLRRSTDLGETWERIVLPNRVLNSIAPSDTLVNYRIDPRNDNNFLVFSVYIENDSTIWSGSAGGLNKSTDGGSSWTKFTTLNQASHILGNWIIAIAGQRLDSSTTRIWTTNWQADVDPNEQYGISYTDDGGITWHNFLQGVKAYDFAFNDSTAYVATEEGIYRTADGGVSWLRSGTIIDPITAQRITTSSFFAVGVLADTVFAGSSDGLVKTIDSDEHPFGETWQIQRTYQHVSTTTTTYAYPNPFSPTQEQIRIHYLTGGTAANVTIEIFDFGMNRVRTVVKDASRSGTTEYDELWNGKDDNNQKVANGVYFYRVEMNGGDTAWGKIMVLQ